MNTKFIPQNEQQIQELIRHCSDSVLTNIEQLYQKVRGAKIPCSKEEVDRIAEKVRQEKFARNMESSADDHLLKEANTGQTKGAAMPAMKYKKSKQKPKNRLKNIKSSEKGSKPKRKRRKTSTSLDKKKQWAIQQWLNKRDLPVVRVRDRMLEKFGAATDWKTLKECRKKAWDRLVTSTPNSGGSSQAISLSASDIPDKVRNRVLSYIMGETEPPPGVEVNVSVHLVT